MARFKKGESGNPSGRPKKDGANLKSLLEKHGNKVLQTVIDLAAEGDLTACKIVLDRLYPPIKPQSLPIVIPVGKTLPESGDNIVTAIMKGNVPPDIGSQLITALANQAKLVEITELVKRIEKLEKKQ